MKANLTHSQKKNIRRRVHRRDEELRERLQDISNGRTIPNKENHRFNEPKQYELGIVFLDIDSYSNYAMEETDIGVLYMLGILMPELMKLVSEHSGYFEKNTGDGLLAYFGFGDDPPVAVSNLLSYLSTVRWALSNEINPLLEEQGLGQISLSGGATYGKVFLSRIGERDLSQELDRLTGVSNYANVANQIEIMASEDEFLIGPNVRHYADRRKFKPYIDSTDHIIPDLKWTNPNTGRREVFQIYAYRGTWEEISEQAEGTKE